VRLVWTEVEVNCAAGVDLSLSVELRAAL